MKTNEQIEIISETLKSMAHPIRLKIIYCLIEKEMDVAEIAQQFEFTISNVSQHLKILRNAGIIKKRRQANHIFYSIKDKNICNILDFTK